MLFDLSSDPHENVNLDYFAGDYTWVFTPVARIIEGYERSVKEYPNIKPGSDFDGYRK